MNNNQRSQKYIKTILLLTGLVIASLLLYKTYISFVSREVKKSPISSRMVTKEAEIEESKIYAIEKMRQERAKDPEEEYAEIQKDYEEYPGKYNVNYIPSPIFKMKQEDRALAIAEFDKDINASKEALKIDPKDKKAKSKLFLSETLKKIVLSTSEYKQREPSPKEKL